MKTRLLLLFVLLYGLTGIAQYSISGNFTPSKDFKWLIAYELTPGSQRYITDTAIEDGYFNLKLPVNSKTGIYRLVYAVPQDEFYIDVLYNGKENIEFNFNLDDGVTFIVSEENKSYQMYLSEITIQEQELIQFYESGNTSKKEFKTIIEKISKVQSKFEANEAYAMAAQLIKANRPYIPEDFEEVETFFKLKRMTYFQHIDVSNNILQSSGFLTDKISNYVFSALPLTLQNKEEMEVAIAENVELVASKLKDTPESFQITVLYDLWKTASSSSLNMVADRIFSNSLKDLAITNGEQAIIDDIELTSRLRLGAISPELTWKENDALINLSDLKETDHYILIFWSSTCSHCLKELPALHKELKNYKNNTVVAVGLEDDETNWNFEIKNLPNFKHALALGKWQSDYAQVFGIKQTPTYFVLDKDKRFIYKPKDDKEVISFLKESSIQN
jgi:thiol-disulfide isomerase/thioredoxin